MTTNLPGEDDWRRLVEHSYATVAQREQPDPGEPGAAAPAVDDHRDDEAWELPSGPGLSLEPRPGGRLDDEGLSALLRFGYGFVRVDLSPEAWPLHRSVPSARCLYPTQLHLVLPPYGARGGGLYSFDAEQHRILRHARSGAVDRVADVVGEPRGGASGWILVTSRLPRLQHRYGELARRLGAQEAGLVVGSLLAVTASLGTSAVGRLTFDRDAAQDLVGTDAETEPVHAVLMLSGADEDSGGVGTTSRTPGPSELERLLRRRHSGPPFVEYLPLDLPEAVVEGVAQALAAAGQHELLPPDLDLRADCYVVVRRVDGLSRGIYRLAPATGALEPVAGGAIPLRDVSKVAEAAVIVYLVVPRRRAVELLGPESFGVLHVLGGVAAFAVCLAAARWDVSARIHNGYAAEEVGRLLGVGASHAVVFQIALGRTRPAPRLSFPVL